MSRKVALVTGASRGIGKASAVALAEAGYDVVVTARTVREGEKYDYRPTLAGSAVRAMPGRLHTAAAEICRRGRKALPIRLDLLDADSIDAAVEQVLREWGRIDLLLNNAIYQGPGIMDRFLDLPDTVIKTVFEGIVFAQPFCTDRQLVAGWPTPGSRVEARLVDHLMDGCVGLSPDGANDLCQTIMRKVDELLPQVMDELVRMGMPLEVRSPPCAPKDSELAPRSGAHRIV